MLKAADKVTAAVFAVGERVDVIGISKGKGFAGVVKRITSTAAANARGVGPDRAPGSIGSGTTPGRVYKGKHMAGHMGSDRVTRSEYAGGVG